MMNQVNSSGAVVFKIIDKNVYYAIVQSSKNLKYGFPKGRLEENEPFRIAAIREIKEETNLDVELYEDIYYDITYQVLDGTLKHVRYYLAKAYTFDLIPQHSEVKRALWVTYEQAFDYLSFMNQKEILETFHNIVLKEHVYAKKSI